MLTGMPKGWMKGTRDHEDVVETCCKMRYSKCLDALIPHTNDVKGGGWSGHSLNRAELKLQGEEPAVLRQGSM